jgi:hypothetical protein
MGQQTIIPNARGSAINNDVRWNERKVGPGVENTIRGM